MAAPNPYDKSQRLKEANTQLKQTKAPPMKLGKVHFNEKVVLYSEDYVTEPRNRLGPPKSGQNKILLVTVPTGFSEDIDECPSDDGDEVSDETGFRWGCYKEPESSSFAIEEEIVTAVEENVDQENKDIEKETDDDVLNQVVNDLSTDLNVKCSLNIDEQSNKDHIQTQPVAPLTETKPDRERAQSAHQTRSRNFVMKRQDAEEIIKSDRPRTAPLRRPCVIAEQTTIQSGKLPSYNGFRSEYGLSAEQLQERKRKKVEMIRALKKEREERYLEEKKRQKENEQMFTTWLVKKKKEAALRYAKKRQQSSFYFRTLPAPTYHLDKMGVLRKKVLSRKEHTCYSLEEFFKHAKPHEQKTYRIYLGLCVE